MEQKVRPLIYINGHAHYRDSLIALGKARNAIHIDVDAVALAKDSKDFMTIAANLTDLVDPTEMPIVIKHNGKYCIVAGGNYFIARQAEFPVKTIKVCLVSSVALKKVRVPPPETVRAPEPAAPAPSNYPSRPPNPAGFQNRPRFETRQPTTPYRTHTAASKYSK